MPGPVIAAASREAHARGKLVFAHPTNAAGLEAALAGGVGLEGKAGRIAPGMEADLVVLDGGPSRDIRALARVRDTLRQGRIIYRR